VYVGLPGGTNSRKWENMGKIGESANCRKQNSSLKAFRFLKNAPMKMLKAGAWWPRSPCPPKPPKSRKKNGKRIRICARGKTEEKQAGGFWIGVDRRVVCGWAGDESTVSGFPFPNRSDKRGGVSQEERFHRSQRGAAKSRAAFPNGPERKTIQPQAGGAPRGLRHWAKSNGQRRRGYMPASTRRRAGRMSEAGFPNKGAGTFRLAGNESNVSGFPFPNRSDNRGGVSQEERIKRSQRGAAKSRAAFPNGPNNGEGRVPIGRNRINRQRFFLDDSAWKELTTHVEKRTKPFVGGQSLWPH